MNLLSREEKNCPIFFSHNVNKSKLSQKCVPPLVTNNTIEMAVRENFKK